MLTPLLMHHMRPLAIIVIITPETGEQIVRQPPDIEPQRREGTFHLGMPHPFVIQRTLHFLRHVFLGQGRLFMIVNTDNSVILYGKIVKQGVVQCIVSVG